MDCPVCQVTMVIMEYKNIELDYCVDCKGIWFDAGEVELLLEGINADSGQLPLKQPKGAVTEARRRCPLCSKTMSKKQVDGTEVLVDYCDSCEGIWFDAGEVIEALNRGNDAEDSLSVKAAREFLGEALNRSNENE